MRFRVGIGYDVHRLVPDRDLILGGVKIDYPYGLLGHSDADVLTHAIIDALIGAMGLGDIGRHFPDTDPTYKGVSSIALLKSTRRLLDENAFGVVNIDSVIVAQKPKFAPYIDRMEENLADALAIDKAVVNVKATTEEGLGFTGDGGGISAKAVVMLQKIDS